MGPVNSGFIPSLLSFAMSPLLKNLTAGQKAATGDYLAKNQNQIMPIDNLSKLTQSTRVEPIAMIDQRLAGLEATTQVMLALSALFTAYYLQAVSLLVNVGRVNTMRLLDSINPNRDVSSAAGTYLASQIMSSESYKYGLPYSDAAVPSFEDNSRVDYGERIRKLEERAGQPDRKSNASSVKIDAGLQKDIINETASLSVGRLVNVTIRSSKDGKEEEATIPIMIRLMANLMAPSILTHILGDNSGNTSAREMFHSWRAKGGGFVNFWRDIVFAQDLIDEHRKTLMKDNTGVYEDILSRSRGNLYTKALTQVPSLNNAANLAVISSQTARELETKIGGRLEDFAVRQRVFKSSYLLFLVVVDTEWDRVTFYTRDIKTPNRLSVKELKVSNKGTGPDVEQILKAYQVGQSPTI